MTLAVSSALEDFIAQKGSWKEAFDNGRLEIYSGAQPSTTSADPAPTGNLLCTITLASGAKTDEVQASGSVALTGGAAGSVDTLTVNSLEIMGSSTPFNTSLAQTAADIALKINRNPKNKLFVASVSANTVVLTAKAGLGTLANGWVVASTATTITKTDTNLASGVNAANGLTFDVSSGGTMPKNSGEVWSGVVSGAGTQTAGWFRLKGAIADDNSLDSVNKKFFRLDGSISTTGADMNMTGTSFVNGVTQTINTFSLTIPAHA